MYLHASIFWRESCQKEFVWGLKVSKIFLSYPLIQWQNIPPLSQGNRKQISASEIYSIGKILKRTHQKKVLFLSKCTASSSYLLTFLKFQHCGNTQMLGLLAAYGAKNWSKKPTLKPIPKLRMSSSAAATCWIDQCYVERHRMWSHLIGSWFSCRKQFDQSENAMTTEGNFERFLEISSFESIAIKWPTKALKCVLVIANDFWIKISSNQFFPVTCKTSFSEKICATI